tara:strand:- start:15306 stop:15830 length:525 start_codon:yes stop_codon:yes gene_type:complete
MFSKFELVVAGVAVFLIAFSVYLFQAQNILFGPGVIGQSAQVVAANSPGIVALNTVTTAPAQVVSKENSSMVIDDIKIGTGNLVQKGDTVSVHYVGSFPDGREFDSSKKRGLPFEFKVGAGQVIEGWEKGLVGMQVGGERVLVIPPEMGYGANGIGPIPGNATLNFTIELLEIK